MQILCQQAHPFRMLCMAKAVKHHPFLKSVSLLFKNLQIPCQCLRIAGNIYHFLRFQPAYCDYELLCGAGSWRIQDYNIYLFISCRQIVYKVRCVGIIEFYILYTRLPSKYYEISDILNFK